MANYLQTGKGHGHLRDSFRQLGGSNATLAIPRKIVIGVVLLIALLAFEIFNFDTTRYALESLLGDRQFWRFTWAAILAFAFCAIDFAGLSRLFTPERGSDEPKFVWYLMGAWLLGATMNAIMTWWAVNLTLLSHDFGNEVLSRGQLLKAVPLFVAILVWLTRILFIGAFSVAGEHLFDLSDQRRSHNTQTRPAQPAGVRLVPHKAQPKNSPQRQNNGPTTRVPAPMAAAPPSRIRNGPPTPRSNRPVPNGMQARSRRR